MTSKIESAGALREGGYVVVDGKACRVVSCETSKSGKHGHAKIRFVAIELFTEKKHDMVLPAHDNVEIPLIEKKSAQVLSVSGDKANVMDAETYETFDLDIPAEMKTQVTEGCQVLYWDIMGQKVMKQLKSAA